MSYCINSFFLSNALVSILNFALLPASGVNNYGREFGPSNGRCWIGIAAQGLTGTGRWMLGPIRLRLAGAGADGMVADEEEDADETATRSHEGHIVRVVGGFMCMYSCGDNFNALSSCTSFCNLLFSSVRFSQHLFKYSQSTSVCFNLVLH